jgi:hypothetical protein
MNNRGVHMGVSNLFSKPKGPSAAEIRAAQEAAAQRERERVAQEEAERKAAAEKKALADLQERESQRQAFAGQLSAEDDTTQRRRFLKGA